MIKSTIHKHLNNSNNLNMNRGQEILIMNVDISEGKKDKIIVHEFDSPELLAKEFVARYKLNPKIVEPLTREIYNNISDIVKQPVQYISTESCEPINPENYGEKLYVKGIRNLEKNENMKQALKIRLEQEQGKELTFKPKINPVSNILAQRMINRSQDSIRRKESIIAKCNNEKQVEQQSACTFAPKINPNSTKILENKKRDGSDRFKELYEEAFSRKLRQENLLKKNEFSFKPEILNNYNTGSSGDRLFYRKSQEDSHKTEDLRDPVTGRDYFVPQINKSSSRNRELPIGEHLYSMQRKNPEPSISVFSNPNLEAREKTEKLMKRAKERRYKEIFDQLNPDEKGVICYDRIEEKFVEPLSYKLMLPLLDELREGNETLTFENFADSMDNLLKILSPDERDVFLIYKRFKEDSIQSSIKKSCSISEITGVYNRQIEKKMNCQARLELEREKKHRNELEGCTFHPQTTPYRIYNPRIDIA